MAKTPHEGILSKLQRALSKGLLFGLGSHVPCFAFLLFVYRLVSVGIPS